MKKIFAVLLLALIGACHQDTVYLSEQDSGHDIVLALGQTAVITLAENPSAGYSWKFEIKPENQTIIGNIKEKYIYQQSKLIGAGGIKEFSFKIENVGKADIYGYYRRSSEKPGSKNEQTVHYTIIAK